MLRIVNGPLDQVDLKRFETDGFLVVKKLFDTNVVQCVRSIAARDTQVQHKVRTGSDFSDVPLKLWISNNLQKSPFAAIVRYERIVSIAEQLLGGEVYHWHHKVIMKDAGSGAWEWHQDYGYWYDYGCLFPDLISCMIAIDEATLENGCVQMVRGSHRLGRLDTSRKKDQTGTGDRRRIESILAELETVYCELSPGDAVFFHANTLHKSAVNRGQSPRWAFISAYNAASNAPRDINPIHTHDPDAPPTPYEALQRWSLDRVKDSVF